MSTVSGIQGQLLEVTVVGCNKLKDTEWISRQDPYVCLEYASTKFRTRTCTDGGKNPVFQEKTVIPLIEGLREVGVTVWNSNTLTYDDFIGSGKIQLQKVLSQGYDDSPWPLQTKSGRFAGEVKVIMHFPNAQKPQKSRLEHASTAQSYMPAAAPYGGPPYAHPPASLAASPYPPVGAYPAPAPYPSSYPPANPAMYPTSAYPPPPVMQQPYPHSAYPPTAYPPQPYPPPPHGQPYGYPPAPGPYPGAYPPPPY